MCKVHFLYFKLILFKILMNSFCKYFKIALKFILMYAHLKNCIRRNITTAFAHRASFYLLTFSPWTNANVWGFSRSCNFRQWQKKISLFSAIELGGKMCVIQFRKAFEVNFSKCITLKPVFLCISRIFTCFVAHYLENVKQRGPKESKKMKGKERNGKKMQFNSNWNSMWCTLIRECERITVISIVWRRKYFFSLQILSCLDHSVHASHVCI